MKPEIGQPIPERRILVRAESMPVWAAALHDPNPIHVDPAAVRAAGLGDRVINQGPANVGYMLNVLAQAFPGARLESFEVRFVGPVRGGDVAIASGQVVAVTACEGGNRAECELMLTIENGGTALTGTASVRLPG